MKSLSAAAGALLVLATVACGSPCRNYCEQQLKEQLVANFAVPEEEACEAPAIDAALTCAACEEAIQTTYSVQPAQEMCSPTGAFISY